jgi:small-conductance mechanosensitive channel
MESLLNETQEIFSQPTAYRSILLLLIAVAAAYILSKFVANLIIKIAQVVSKHTDNETNEEQFIRLRRVETYLSVSIAVVRAVIVAVVAYVVWRFISPSSSSGIAAIGAGTLFIVVAGQTLGVLLRDITSGSVIIVEEWFQVGDYVKIEPFMDVSGVVERLTLRSTKIRALSGEVIWIHNQQITAAHVTPRGVRTIAVDVFIRDLDRGVEAVNELIKAMPVGPTMLAAPLTANKPEKLADNLWSVTVIGQTAPGREWLMERYFTGEIIAMDEKAENRADRIFMHNPIARYADPDAIRKFKRAVRARKG